MDDQGSQGTAPVIQKSHFECRNEDTRSETKKSREGHAPLHTYREVTHMRALERAFLGGGSIPPGFDEDAPTVTAVVAVAATELDGAYKILDSWVSSINTGKTIVPLFWLDVTDEG
jgi:hypothetical protein